MIESTADIDALKKAHKEGKTILARLKGCQSDPWSPTAKPTWSPMFDYKVDEDAPRKQEGAFIVPALLWVLALIFVVGFMLAVPVAISCEQHITLPAWSPFDTHKTIEATLFP